MYPIVKKEVLNPTVSRMEILAPYVAAKAQPGQFIILPYVQLYGSSHPPAGYSVYLHNL